MEGPLLLINTPKFTICGVNSIHYESCVFRIAEGNYTVVAKGYSMANGRGEALPGQNMSFSVVSTSAVDGVVAFSLINPSENNAEVARYSSDITFDRAEMDLGRWNIQAITAPNNTHQVQFYLNGRHVRTDKEYPFVLCETTSMNYCRLTDGKYQLSARAYALVNNRTRAYNMFAVNMTVYTSRQVEGVFNISARDYVTGEIISRLHNNSVIDRSNFTYGLFNFIATTAPSEVDQVSFYLNGAFLSHNQEAALFCLLK